LAYRLYKYAKSIEEGQIEDNGFYYKIYEADQDLDIADPKQRKEALEQSNPALGDWVDAEQLERAFQQIPENEFRRYFLNQWTSTAERWLPAGVWEECYEEKKLELKSKIILGFDGSYSRDSTALVGLSFEEERPHLEVLGHWERPVTENKLWKIPRDEVIARIHKIFKDYEVVEFVVDPMGFHSELAELEDQYGEDMILYFEGNYRKRMAEATSRFYTAVLEKDLSHDGDFDLFQHLINCVPKETPQGTLVTKINKSSARKIDLAIASIMVFDRWSDLRREDPEPESKAPEFITF
jgi:phage terminase large subunit-like protein